MPVPVLVKRIASGIRRRLDFSEKARVKRLMKNPPKVKEDHIVFSSSGDFTGNPKALFLYMIENGYNKKYRMTWMFEHKENMIDFGLPNVDSVLIWNEKDGERTYAAQKAAMSAKYVFYSHNVNWVRKYGDDQLFINLWHGCGYKGNVATDKKKIYYDYVMVTGKAYIDVFKEHLKDPDGNILDLGYPRNEFFFTERSNAKAVLNGLKKEAGADKAIIWMPTYRKSTLARLDADTAMGETGLPILYTPEDIRELDHWCRDNKVLVVLKQHILQCDYSITDGGLRNIIFIDDTFLKNQDADLYELMAGTDAMLTDYSSAAIDYMLLDKPIGYTLDDFDKYEDARGWCLENVKEYMSGHHIYDMTELKQFITDVAEDKDPHRAWRERIAAEVHTYRDGFSKRILDRFGIKLD